VQRSERAHVTDEQAQVYFGWFRASRPVFTVALECGFRVGDLLRLEWSRVDLRQGLVSFIQSKSGKAVSVPMSSACREALQDLKSRPLASHRWVFTQKNGQRYSLTTLRDHFATAKKISGITRRLRLHDLRHSLASKLVSEGISLQIVQGVLGHASIVTTQRYARPDEAARRTVADALDRRRTAASKPNASNGESTAGGGPSKS
jgi:integrase